jgi:peptide/nickel transport system ATP-binding protein
MTLSTKDAATPVIAFRDVVIEAKTKAGWKTIVDGVTFSLKPGEVLGLIGESGAGKSTIGLAAMGYVRTNCRFVSGTIHFEGLDLVTAGEDASRLLRSSRIAYVAQSAAAAFNPAHRLMDQCVEVPVQRGILDRGPAEQIVRDLFERTRLPAPDQFGQRYPHQVSGGQLQRAMTAMALVADPKLVIFDEPTTALDVTTQVEVLSAIRKVVREKMTAAIYITHDLAVVAQMADRILVLKDGKMVEEGDTGQIMSAPKAAYTKSLWAVRHFRAPDKAIPHEPEEPFLRIENVTAGYGSVDALKNISCEIYAGQTVAFVGESGSGKTTVARCVTGLLKPKTGRILLNGKVAPPSFRKRSIEQLRHAQMIYQMSDTALNPKQTIREIIARPVQFYLGLKGQQLDARVREILTQVELDPDIYSDRYPPQLSGGQKQRVGIARALAASPKLIICDEVTSALDQIVAESILKLLVKLQQSTGVAYMFITHDLATVRAIADHVLVMEQGRIVESRKVEDLFADPREDYTQKLLSAVPQMNPDWLTNLLEGRNERSGTVAQPAD